MSRATAIVLAERLAWVSGVLALILAVVLVVDGFREKGRAAAEDEIVAALEEQIPTDAAAAEVLATETERQTRRSVARETRNVRLGWALLVTTVLFLITVKGRQELVSGRQPALVSIGASRAHESIARERARQAPPAALPAAEAVDLEFVDSVIAATGSTRESTIPILQGLQTKFRFLPEDALLRVCEKTEIEPSQIMGVASFYSQFRRDPVGRVLVRVCHGTACHVAGIGPIMDEMRRRLEIPADADTDPQRRFTLELVNCLGCCSLAPVMMVEEHVAGHLTPTRAWDELAAAEVQT